MNGHIKYGLLSDIKDFLIPGSFTCHEFTGTSLLSAQTRKALTVVITIRAFQRINLAAFYSPKLSVLVSDLQVIATIDAKDQNIQSGLPCSRWPLCCRQLNTSTGAYGRVELCNNIKKALTVVIMIRAFQRINLAAFYSPKLPV